MQSIYLQFSVLNRPIFICLIVRWLLLFQGRVLRIIGGQWYPCLCQIHSKLYIVRLWKIPFLLNYKFKLQGYNLLMSFRVQFLTAYQNDNILSISSCVMIRRCVLSCIQNCFCRPDTADYCAESVTHLGFVILQLSLILDSNIIWPRLTLSLTFDGTGLRIKKGRNTTAYKSCKYILLTS